MALRLVVENEPLPSAVCWCCGGVEARDRLVRFGIPGEVAICTTCAYRLNRRAKQLHQSNRPGLTGRAWHAVNVIRHAVDDHRRQPYRSLTGLPGRSQPRRIR